MNYPDILGLIRMANQMNLTEFAFSSNGKTYVCSWEKCKWSDPRQVINFGDFNE